MSDFECVISRRRRGGYATPPGVDNTPRVHRPGYALFTEGLGWVASTSPIAFTPSRVKAARFNQYGAVVAQKRLRKAGVHAMIA